MSLDMSFRALSRFTRTAKQIIMTENELPDHALIGQAAKLPTSPATPVISVSPVVLKVPGRLVDLQVKISAPTNGSDLPIILLSHGQGRSNHLSSLNGYSPLVNFWAGHGFAVIQPTHLSSKTLKFEPKTSGGPMFWKSRVEDMSHIIDQRDNIEASVPAIQGRLDWSRIAVAGHSMGGHTAGMLLGAGLTDPASDQVVNLIETRIKAGVLLAAPGADRYGGATQTPMAKEMVPFFVDPIFDTMTTPTLVVEGDADEPHYLTTRGMQWHRDPYTLSRGPKSLLTLFGAGHILGGISGYDAAECDDENIERAGAVQRLTWAYLRSALYPGDGAWSEACAALKGLDGIGKVESK